MAKHHLPEAQKLNGKQPTATVVKHAQTNPPTTRLSPQWRAQTGR